MLNQKLKFLEQFSDYLLNEIGSQEHLLWLSVLQNHYPDSNGYLFHRVALDEDAWVDACRAFGNLTRVI